MTGARVLHGPNPADEIVFADTAREGDVFEIGKLRISVLETPGHTDDHLAFVLHDVDFPEGPVGVFTGDALFVGDVGRTDFYPERARDRKSVVQGKRVSVRVDLGGRSIIKKQKQKQTQTKKVN